MKRKGFSLFFILCFFGFNLTCENNFIQKKCPVFICDFGKNFEFRYPINSDPKIETLSGIIKTNKNGFIGFEADSGEYYILTNDKKFVSKSGKNVSWNDIKNQNGKRLVISGMLNSESGIFTVIGFENVSRVNCL